MKVIALPKQTRDSHLATHKVIISYTDVAALGASATGTLALFPINTAGAFTKTFPAGTVARFAGLNLLTAFDFSDAGITSLTAEVGDGTDPNRLLTATELAVDGTEILYKVEGAVTQPYAYLAADTIDVLFTAANGGSPLLSECTSGEVEIYLHITDSNALERAR